MLLIKFMNVIPMGQQAFAAQKGAKCPLCRSTNIFGGAPNRDGLANAHCRDCKSEWTGLWSITGYDNLNDDKTPEEVEEIKARIYAKVKKKELTS